MSAGAAENNRYQAVVIGSGISGLTCAALLAKKGRSVLVLEQHTKPGGYMHCFSRFGAQFDTGAHYVGAMEPGQSFHTILSYLGARPEDYFTPLDPDGFDVLRFPNREIQLPKGYAPTIARLSAQFPVDAPAIREYYERIERVAANFPTYEFGDDTDFPLVMQSLETPLSSVVEKLTADPLLRSVLYSYCALHGVEPEDVSFGLHALVTDSLVRGPFGLKRGGDALASRLVEIVREHGGEILYKRKVKAIENSGKLASAVITEQGERFEADWIISSAHPRNTFGMATDPTALSPAFRERLAKIPESPGLFGIYGILQGSVGNAGLARGRNYYYFSSEDSRTMLKPGRPYGRPNCVFLCPAERVSPTGGESASEGFRFSAYAISPSGWFADWEGSRYGKRPEEYQARKAEYAAEILKFIGEFEPSVAAHVGKHATSTPVTNLHFNGSHQGSAYGIYHSIAHTGPRALGPRTHIANLLLTGQNCLFPGLLGGAISAIRTAGHVIGMKPLLAELREVKQRNSV